MGLKNLWHKLFPTKEMKEIDSKQRIKDLILQKTKPKRISNTGIDAQEANWYHIRTRYKMACLFGLAAKMPDGVVPLMDGSQIAPTKEHSQQALRSAIKMREQVLEEYGVDLEELVDE